jgi:hypothetical protein
MDRPANSHLTGWCIDPYGRHQHRWLTKGMPTALVGDGGVESQDPPPDGPFVVQPRLVGAASVEGDDLRRAGDSTPSDAGQAVWGETIGRMPYT